MKWRANWHTSPNMLVGMSMWDTACSRSTTQREVANGVPPQVRIDLFEATGDEVQR